MTDLDSILARVDAGLDRSVDRFIELLSLPSVSSEPDGAEGIARCAEWLRDELSGLAFDAAIVATAGHPVILASRSSRPGAPTYLFYGHYDVQPAAPLDAWVTPPFEANIRDEDGLRRIYARGASDSKGQVWSVIEAIRAWHEVGVDLPFNITILLEGEEETGSPSLAAFIDSHRDALASDVAFVSDSDMWSPTRPAITTRLKGLLHEKVTVYAPNGDLHSGHFGNVAANPIRVLSQVLTSLHDAVGRVTIPGFYDGVEDISPTLRSQWNALNVDEALAGTSVEGGPTEGGRSTVELMWGRPGIDFNGIVGGNTGSGERSVLPGSAYARLSFRLVGGQRPDRIRQLFRSYIKAQLPPGCRVEFEGQGGSGAVTVNDASPFVAATARALDAEWPEPTLIKGTGGAVPLVELLTDRLGVDCIVTGFILADDAIHAPNERYDIERLRKGTRSWVRILGELADV